MLWKPPAFSYSQLGFLLICSNENSPGNLQECLVSLVVVDLAVKQSIILPCFLPLFHVFFHFCMRFSAVGTNLSRPPEQSWSVSLPQEDPGCHGPNPGSHGPNGPLVVGVCSSYKQIIAPSNLLVFKVNFPEIWWLM